MLWRINPKAPPFILPVARGEFVQNYLDSCDLTGLLLMDFQANYVHTYGGKPFQYKTAWLAGKELIKHSLIIDGGK